MSKNGFTIKQSLFIKNYIVNKNATKAALLAGYSPKTAYSQGHRLLKNVEISVAIGKGLTKQLEDAGIDAGKALLELKTVAFWDPINGSCPGKMKALELLGEALGLFCRTNKSIDKSNLAAAPIKLDRGDNIPL